MHIKLGSLKNEEVEKIALDLDSLLNLRNLFNAWGDLCLELYPSEQVKNGLIQKIMTARFKDKNGIFSTESELFFKVEARLKAAVMQIKSNLHVTKRKCPPDAWPVYYPLC